MRQHVCCARNPPDQQRQSFAINIKTGGHRFDGAHLTGQAAQEEIAHFPHLVCGRRTVGVARSHSRWHQRIEVGGAFGESLDDYGQAQIVIGFVV